MLLPEISCRNFGLYKYVTLDCSIFSHSFMYRVVSNKEAGTNEIKTMNTARFSIMLLQNNEKKESGVSPRPIMNTPAGFLDEP